MGLTTTSTSSCVIGSTTGTILNISVKDSRGVDDNNSSGCNNGGRSSGCNRGCCERDSENVVVVCDSLLLKLSLSRMHSAHHFRRCLTVLTSCLRPPNPILLYAEELRSSRLFFQHLHCVSFRTVCKLCKLVVM